jgi:hypothetical protein
MSRIFLTLTLCLGLPSALPADTRETRKPNPFAPSLPQLTDEEEDAIDRVIDRFILYDTGRLRGAEGKKALADFQKLGIDAIFGLIRGLNRAAKIEASCPALTIAKKIASLLRTTRDRELLEFARENIGAGVTRSRHMGLLRELRVVCMLRKRALPATATVTRAPRTTPKVKPPRSMSVDELASAARTERGPRRKQLLTELATRQGEEVINALSSAAATPDAEIGPLGRRLLASHLARQEEAVIRKRLKDERDEVRAAAAKAVGSKGLRLGEELIGLLGDSSSEVRQAARQSLVKLSKGTDYGPKADASETERSESVRKWRAWWARQSNE